MADSKALDALGLVVAYLHRLVREKSEDASALRTAISGGEDMQSPIEELTELHEIYREEAESHIALLKQLYGIMPSFLFETTHYHLC